MAAGRYGYAQRRVQIKFESLQLFGLIWFSRSASLRSSPMLFVDLLTRPGQQGEALREPRLRHRLRISIILLLRQNVFHS